MSVRIGRTNNQYATIASPDAADPILKRAGLSLQKILRNEYGDVYADKSTSDNTKATLMQEQNPLLAHLGPAQALNQLRKELRNYQKGIDPFNRRLRDNESVLDWWTAVQQDDDAQVLGVRLASQFRNRNIND